MNQAHKTINDSKHPHILNIAVVFVSFKCVQFCLLKVTILEISSDFRMVELSPVHIPMQSSAIQICQKSNSPDVLAIGFQS